MNHFKPFENSKISNLLLRKIRIFLKIRIVIKRDKGLWIRKVDTENMIIIPKTMIPFVQRVSQNYWDYASYQHYTLSSGWKMKPWWSLVYCKLIERWTRLLCWIVTGEVSILIDIFLSIPWFFGLLEKPRVFLWKT